VRLVAWNVAHAARECPLRPGLLDAIASLEPDVLTLSQYVHGASRAAFVAGLADLGLRHVLLSASWLRSACARGGPLTPFTC